MIEKKKNMYEKMYFRATLQVEIERIQERDVSVPQQAGLLPGLGGGGEAGDGGPGVPDQHQAPAPRHHLRRPGRHAQLPQEPVLLVTHSVRHLQPAPRSPGLGNLGRMTTNPSPLVYIDIIPSLE